MSKLKGEKGDWAEGRELEEEVVRYYTTIFTANGNTGGAHEYD